MSAAADDGAAINSSWVTKDFTLGYPHNFKSLNNLWIEAKFTTGTILSVGYAINKKDEFISRDINLGQSSTTINARVPVVDGFVQGKYFKFKFST